MGIHLMDNFSAPYYARSVKDFWRRWHISLSGWFRDYLYIPLGGNRKGEFRKCSNLLIVFAISGLWHGASMAFVFWGILNGVYQVIEELNGKMKSEVIQGQKRWKWLEKLQISRKVCFSTKLFQTIITFALVTFAWLFFRAGGLEDAKLMITNMFRINNWMILFDGSLYGLGVEKNYMNILLGSIFVLFFIDYYKYHGKDVAEVFLEQGWWFRVICIMLLIFTILLYGCYGELYNIQQFIYFQF